MVGRVYAIICFQILFLNLRIKAHLHLWTTLTEKTAKEIETLHSVETSFINFNYQKRL